MDIPTWKLTSFHLLGLAGGGVVIGAGLRRVFPILHRLSVPQSVLGGLVFALATLLLRPVVQFEVDTSLRDLLMVGFFTTIGLGASLRLLKVGGRRVAIFLGASVLGLVAQIIVGAAIARALGLKALFGVIPGAVSLTGGPATALAFGPEFEKAGVTGATTVGVASAVFGIVVSGVLGGYVGNHLVRRDNLTPTESDKLGNSTIQVDAGPGEKHGSLLAHVIVIGVCMALGSLVGDQFKRWGLTLPAYIGAMLVAGVMRNLDDAFQFAGIDQEQTQTLGDIALELFIVMALVTLQLWQLAALALPVLLILSAQVILTIILSWTAVYWTMGRSYTAAVMSGGYCGFMLGTTANAMACMNEIVRKHGPAPQAFFAVGIVGAFLIDFVNALLITQAIHILK
ncbi:MAG: sodium/glutamate symporter [Polyangiaceae bacterium]|nr:sodium/glutamate symporter [Polyangiaceae bacterium]